MPDFRRCYPPDSTVKMEPAADGWPLRVFRWPAENPRGSILFQGGRGDIIEKYLESFAHWHGQGWNIDAFDWRGQGGSGRFLSDPLVGHVPDFAVWIEDLAEFHARWIGDTSGPHIVMGHSMGGHLILRALAEKRIAPDVVVLVAPMLGFETGVLPLSLAAGFVKAAAWLAPERSAWKSNERPAASRVSRQGFLTHDPDRYADEIWWKSEKPELALGPPSLRWLAQAYASCLALEAPDKIEQIATPMLIIGTKGDRLVSPEAIPRFAARLPGARLKMFDDGVAHEILRERDDVRNQALSEIDAFLATVKANG